MLTDLKVVEWHEHDTQIDWCCIFNTYSFFELHKKPESVYFVLQDSARNTILGLCHFTEVSNGVFRSPYRGTFAGFELKDDNLEHLIFFIQGVENILRQRNARQLLILAPPFQHKTSSSTHLFNALFNAGYSIENQEINYGVRVDETELIEKMNRNNKKRLRKCIREGFVFTEAHGNEEFKEVYDIITVNRESKGYQVSMTFEEINQMKELFSDSVYFFKVSVNDRAIASSICIRINADVLYVFYWGDKPGYEQHSPIVLVADGIYRFAQDHKFKLVDAGTSTIRGMPNFGLIRFKENLGFAESIKLSYTKLL